MSDFFSKIWPFGQQAKTQSVNYTDEGKDPALVAAWRRLLDYDDVSSFQKKRYVQLREWVITIGVLTTTLAVISTLFIPNIMKLSIRYLLIILPLVSAAIIAYGERFASSVWIDFRVSAEKIRSAIYKYRMKAGEYNTPDEQQRQNFLAAVVEAERKAIENQPRLVPYLRTDKITVSAQLAGRSDDGFQELTIDDYIRVRAANQREWYVNRISTDHRNLRRYFLMTQVVAIMGGLLSGFGFEYLVAITASVGAALTMVSDIRLFGATYALFHLTATRLEDEINKWRAKTEPHDAPPTPEEEANFVVNIEDILSTERDMWQEQARLMQARVEQSIKGTQLELTAREQDRIREIAEAASAFDVPLKPHEGDESTQDDEDENSR